jgi:hypothetical protein
MRESVIAVLKAALAILTMISGIASILLYAQANIYKNPTLPDSDRDGFLDVDERGWWTNWLDPHDNPLTARILPAVIAAIAIAVVLALGKVRRRSRAPNLVPTLRKKANAMKSAVYSGNRPGIESCKAEFDAAVAEIVAGSHREVLKEPAIQDVLVEFEMLCLDAFVDDEKLGSMRPVPGKHESTEIKEKESD